MGCDIHMYVEKKITGLWWPADIYEGDDVPYRYEVYEGRNYELFGLLTGGQVRYSPEYDCFCLPKGMPKDVSDKVLNVRKIGGVDYHSESYFTLEELENYRWHKRVNVKAFLTAELHTVLKHELQNENMNYRLISELICYRSREKSKTRNYRIPVKSLFMNFYEIIKYKLPSYHKYGRPSNEIRIVFWFDS